MSKKNKLSKTADAQFEAAQSTKTYKAFGILPAAQSTSARIRKGNAWVALKYFDAGFECFSNWSGDELQAFSAFLEKMGSMDWDTVHRHGGLQLKHINLATIKAGKSNIERVLKKADLEDSSLFELRVTQEVRVHGFRVEDTFFLVLLDHEHRLYPE